MKLPKRLKITFRDVSRKVRVDEFEIGIEGVLKWVSEEFHLKIDTFHLVSSFDTQDLSILATDEDIEEVLETKCPHVSVIPNPDLETPSTAKISPGFLLCQDEGTSFSSGRPVLFIILLTCVAWGTFLVYSESSGIPALLGGRSIPPPTPEKIPSLAVVDNTLNEIEKTRQRLCSLWPNNTNCEIFKKGDTSDIDNTLLQTRMLHRILNEVEAQFVLYVTGSSTSAGHDCHFDYSYPVQMERYLKPIFGSVDVNLKVYNEAMGGWDYRSGANYCMNNIAAKDADVVFWEWGCFAPTSCSQEVFARAALSLEQRPSVVFFEYFGGGKPGAMWHSEEYYALAMNKHLADEYHAHKACNPERSKPVDDPERFLDENWLKQYMLKAKCPKQRREGSKWYKEHSNELYKYVNTSHIQNAIKEGRYTAKELFASKHSKYYQENGFDIHRMSAAITGSQDFDPWWMYRMDLFRVAHHAGVLGHLLASHMITYSFLGTLRDALYRVKENLLKSTIGKLATDVKNDFEKHLEKPLPSPRECSFEPNEFPNSPADCFTAFRPRTGPGLEALLRIGKGDRGSWHQDKAELHQKVGWYMNKKVGNYRDIKGDVSATRTQGWIHFQLPRRSRGFQHHRNSLANIIICQGDEKLNNLADSDIMVDGVLWY
ncbi:hypothetical protein AAMO2058_000569700, partial [Amorphochlora amoebiformis]